MTAALIDLHGDTYALLMIDGDAAAHKKLISTLADEKVERGALTASLTGKLKEGMRAEDEEGGDKLGAIEVELQEIAQGVRENVSRLIERGEKFDSLTKKSEALSSVSSGLKKRATEVRKQSEASGIFALINWLLGLPRE